MSPTMYSDDDDDGDADHTALGEQIPQASNFAKEKSLRGKKLPGLDVEVPATALLAWTVFTRVAGVKVEGEETREVPAT